MKNYGKILKWLMVIFILISVGIVVKGFATDFAGGSVDMIMNWAYVMVILAIAGVVLGTVLVTAINDPKGLLKLLGVCVGIVAVCGAVYAISAGAPAIGLSVEQPDATTLKLTDTVLNLTYLAAGGAVLSIILGEIISAIRNK